MKNGVVKIGLEKIKKYKNKNENKYNVMRMNVNKKLEKLKNIKIQCDGKTILLQT